MINEAGDETANRRVSLGNHFHMKQLASLARLLSRAHLLQWAAAPRRLPLTQRRILRHTPTSTLRQAQFAALLLKISFLCFILDVCYVSRPASSVSHSIHTRNPIIITRGTTPRSLSSI